jgi:hypothetical protein
MSTPSRRGIIQTPGTPIGTFDFYATQGGDVHYGSIGITLRVMMPLAEREVYTGSALALLMARVAAHDEDHAPAAYDLATFADALNAGADLHGGTFPTENDGIVESESV